MIVRSLICSFICSFICSLIFSSSKNLLNGSCFCLFVRYIDILIQLSGVEGTKHGRVIANQVLDVVVRVKAVRNYAVPVFAKLFDQPSMFIGIHEKNTSCEVLFAAAWIGGEFAEWVFFLD